MGSAGGPPKAVEVTDQKNANVSPVSSPSISQKKDSQDMNKQPDVRVRVAHDLPTETELDKCADLLVTGVKGWNVPFRSLIKGEGKPKHHLVIYIRHFFCGNCQDYIRALSAAISPSSLSSAAKSTAITIIGCGSPDLIPMYRAATSCPFPIYAAQTTELYDVLGMVRTLDIGSRKPDYVQSSLLSAVVSSIWQGVKQGPINAFKGGDVKQVGGEFLFDGETGKVLWCHRMRTTRDHAEIPVLKRILELDERAERGKKS